MEEEEVTMVHAKMDERDRDERKTEKQMNIIV